MRSIVKRELINRVRKRKSLTLVDIGGDKKGNIYLNEELGHGVYQIWNKVRALKREKIITNCYRTAGRIFYQANDTSNFVICNSIEELSKLEPEVIAESEEEGSPVISKQKLAKKPKK